MAIRVLIIDESPTLCIGLNTIIESDPELQLIGEARTGSEGINKAAKLIPCIMILDNALPDMPGEKVIKEVKNLGLITRILCFSGFDDEDHVFNMLDAGAIGYVLKKEPTNTLILGFVQVVHPQGVHNVLVSVVTFIRSAHVVAEEEFA
jgi:DNA-binding NarL/FixJ family response regulator